jgi:quercetin dioxygenase-like cupin family protein
VSERDETDIVRPAFVRRDGRGSFTEVLNTGRWESVIVAEMRREAVLGHHYHREADVFLYLITGRAEVVEIEVESGATRRRPLLAGEGIMLHVNVAHAIRFDEDSSVILLKSKQYNSAEPDTYAYSVPI